MATKYNPFTDALDFVSSGGSSYIDGVVADSSLLPTTIGTPALDAVYLAKAGSGVWLINRRPAGLYCRVANNGVAADWQFLGAFPEVNADGNWALYNSATPSKELKFDLSGISASTVRTLTVPDASGTIATTADFAAPPAIGNTTPNSGAFTTLTANNGTLTANAPVLDLSQTWNNSGVQFVGLLLNATNTSSLSTSQLARFSVGGSERFGFRQNGSGSSDLSWDAGVGTSVHRDNGVMIRSSNVIRWSNSSTSQYASADLILLRDAAATLAQRDGTNPQTFRLYNTYTDASNHERGFMRWSSNVLQVGTEKAGTGSARALEFQTDGVTRFTIGTTETLSSANSRIVLDAVTPVAHFGNTPRISLYGGNTQYLALGNAHDIRWSSTGRSDQASSPTIQLARDADGILAQRAGTTAQTWRLYNTVSGTNNVNFDRVNFGWVSNEFVIDAEAGGTGTLRGIKIGSATSSLLGFYGATPVDQPATVADPAGGGTIDAEARTAIGEIIDRLQELGLIAT